MSGDNAKGRIEELSEYVRQVPRPRGFIYVVRERRTGMVKVGYSIDPVKRFNSVVSQMKEAMEAILRQIADVEPEFELVTVVAATPEAEWFIHTLLSSAKIAGEWYKESQIVDAVVRALEILRMNNYRLIVSHVEDISDFNVIELTR